MSFRGAPGTFVRIWSGALNSPAITGHWLPHVVLPCSRERYVRFRTVAVACNVYAGDAVWITVQPAHDDPGSGGTVTPNES
jgi:hypothetical protein